MNTRMYYFAICVLCSIGLCFGQNGGECAGQWMSFAQCMHQQQRVQMDQMGLSKPSDEERRNLDANVRTCFKKFGCRDPLAPEAETKARLECFRKSQQKLRSELQDCVKKRINHFALPEDNFGHGDPWNIYLKSLNDAVKHYERYCQKKTSQRDLRTCVEDALTDFVKKRSGPGRSPGGGSSQPGGSGPQSNGNPNQKSHNYCQIKANCKRSNNNNNNSTNSALLTDLCENEWRQKAVPALCNCDQEIRYRGRVRAYEADFVACMTAQKIKVNTSSESAFGWLENGLDAWCSKQTNSEHSGDSCNPIQNTDLNRPVMANDIKAQPPSSSSPQPPSSTATTAGFGNFLNWFRPTTPTTPSPSPDWNGQNGGGDTINQSTVIPTSTSPQNGGGFFGTPSPNAGFGGAPNFANIFGGNSGGFGNFFGGNGGGFGSGSGGSTFEKSGGNGGGLPFGGNGGNGGGLPFGGNGGNGGLPFGGGNGGGGGLFGGLLNNLGLGNPFDAGGIFGSFFNLGTIFQNLLSGFGG